MRYIYKGLVYNETDVVYRDDNKKVPVVEVGKEYVEIEATGEAPYYTQTYSDSETLTRVTRTFSATPAFSLAALKEQKIAEIKRQAGVLLTATDWYVIRDYETTAKGPKKAIPQNISDSRAAIRAASDQAEADIDAITDYAALVLYKCVWPQ